LLEAQKVTIVHKYLSTTAVQGSEGYKAGTHLNGQ